MVIRRILHKLLLSCLLFHIAATAQYNEESFERITIEAGLSSSVVTCILKDSRGFMWFGTQDGLNKYDGYSFTTYRQVDSLKHSITGNYILSLFEDKEGYIWVGTENTGLNRYDRFTDQFTAFTTNESNSAAITDNSVRATVQFPDGTLFFGTKKGVNSYDPKTQQFKIKHFLETDSLANHLPVVELYLDADNSLWIGTSNGLFHYLKEENVTKAYFHDPENESTLSNDYINSIKRLQNGNLYIGTNLGLNVFNPDDETFNRYYYNQDAAFSEAKSEVQALAEDPQGNLWVGSFGGGLIYIEEGLDKSSIYTNEPDQETSISNDYVYSLLYDDSGILWIGTYGGGINKIDLLKIRFDHLEADKNNMNSLPGNDVYNILPLEDEVWFGTDNGLCRWEKDRGIFERIEAEGNSSLLKGNTIYCLLEDSRKNLWIGTAENGLNKLASENRRNGVIVFEAYTEDSPANQKIPSNEVLCLHEDKENNLWAGTLNGISILRNDNVVATFRNDPSDSTSLADNEVYCIYTDNKSRTWIGTFRGLSRFNPADSSFVHYKNLLGAGQLLSSIYCLHEDQNGFLWVGTDNSGLIKFDLEKEQTIRHYTKRNGLPDNVIYGILEDDEQNLWLSTNNGIIKAIQQANSDELTFIHYNSSNWLKSDSYNIGASAKGLDGVLYFGGFEGVTHFHPDNVKGNTRIPPVSITSFRIFFEPVNISDDKSTPLGAHITETTSIRLKHNENVLTLGFSALNYIGTENNRYAFMMENLEDRWNYSDHNREAQYMYIPPGEYIFRVKASNNNGVWNEEGTAIAITITPPFTQTLWFYIIVITIAVILFFWIMNLRTRRYKAARIRLEKQVLSRTQELRQTNQNLEEEITERKKVQDALAKSEARFRQLIETMNEGFSVQDKEGRINYVNPKLCTMFGRKQQEIIGKFPVEFIDDSSPDNAKRYNSYRDQSITSGATGSYEMNWKRKDGSIFVAMVSPKPIFDEKNNYSGSVAVLTDITDLKTAEKLLLTKNKDLNLALDDLKKTQAQLIDSEKMASLGQLTAGVAHEINNPINFVSGNVQPLRRDINDILDVLKQYDQIIEELNMGGSFQAVEEFKTTIDFDFVLSEINSLLDGIGEGATRTAEIVKGLRNFSRLDEHELKMADINHGIDSTLLILHNKIKTRINIIKEYGDFPDVMCHPGQMNQVFMNLLNNAQESIETEGTIVIRSWNENHLIKISIKDSGRGIPDKVKKKIFEPFYTTKDVGKGTGLGLSISFGIIEKHNGNIEVLSEPGKGSEFIVSIPDNLA